MNVMDKIAVVVIAIIVFSLATAAGIQYSDDTPPTIFKKEDVLTHEVKAGGIFEVQFVIERIRNDCRVSVARLFYDGEGFRWPAVDENFPVNPGPIGPDAFKEQLVVPEGARPGKAIFRSVRTYWCNTVQRLLDKPVIVRTPDVEFTIVP
jgi:hypothetical protein